jgi:hypothetical protein
VRVRSAIVAEYMVKSHMETSDILECIKDTVVEAIKRKGERNAQRVLSN